MEDDEVFVVDSLGSFSQNFLGTHIFWGTLHKDLFGTHETKKLQDHVPESTFAVIVIV